MKNIFCVIVATLHAMAASAQPLGVKDLNTQIKERQEEIKNLETKLGQHETSNDDIDDEIDYAGTSMEYKSKYDEFDKMTSNSMQKNFILSDDKDKSSLPIGFDIYVHKFDTGYVYISVAATFRSDAGLFIADGESLQLIVDGKVIKLKTEGAQQDVVDSGLRFILDFAFYKITPSQIRKIAYAKSVKVRLVGKRRYATGHFAPRNFENVKEFYRKFLLPLSFK
jgi:hypothetical protein